MLTLACQTLNKIQLVGCSFGYILLPMPLFPCLISFDLDRLELEMQDYVDSPSE